MWLRKLVMLIERGIGSRVGFLILAALLTASCNTEPGKPSAEVQTRESVEPASKTSVPLFEDIELRALAYDCERGLSIVVEKGSNQGSVSLILPDRRLELSRLESESGNGYGDGLVEFWSKGLGEASIQFEGKKIGCRENHRHSIREDARLRGVAIWASGNEPGWILEIGKELSMFKVDYGQEVLEFSTPVPKVDRERARTIYLHSGERELEIQVRSETCTDSMTGERFRIGIEISFDGRKLNGCGMALH